MFANVGWGEMLVLVIAGLVILGPERLPGAIRWTSGALRQARDYISGATSQLREDLGPEFDDLREPLSELNKLRGMSPRAALTKHLLDGDDSIPFADRVLRPAASSVARRVGALTPGGHLDAIHARLLKAGLATKVRAEEIAAMEVGATLLGLGAAIAFVALRHPPGRIAVGTLVLLPVIGLLAVVVERG